MATKISDEAVEAFKRAAYFSGNPDATEAEYLDDKEEGDALNEVLRAGLEAAQPYMQWDSE